MFQRTCSAIDMSIEEFHGVKCYRDGDQRHEDKNNIYFMHICDILNVIDKRRSNEVPELKIKTSLFQSLPEVGVVNELESRYLNPELFDFVVIHLDFLYLCYGYYCNHSFMAIRTTVEHTSFFMNDEHFLKHQKGKLLELNQNELRLHTRIMYRSI